MKFLDFIFAREILITVMVMLDFMNSIPFARELISCLVDAKV